MKRWLTLAGLVILPAFVYAQKIQLINSGEVIEKSRELRDSSKYEEAIKALQTISERDTNYVFMLSELANLYLINDQFDLAIATANNVLKKPSLYESFMLRVRAAATASKGEFEKSIALYEEAHKKRPFDVLILYSMGNVYYDHKDYTKAAECYFKVLAQNPFHTSSHLNLGRIAMLSGHKTHGMFSLGIFLSINPTDNSRLVLLNNFVSNQLTDEGTISAEMPNGCEKLDQIIKSRIALDKSFKTKVDFDAAVVSQFEMLFQQLGSIKTNANDAWVNHYLHIYKTLNEKNLVEPFIYNMIKSADKDPIKKWINKNEKTMNVFYEVANQELKRDRGIVDATGVYGFIGKIPAWYKDDNTLGALGVSDNNLNSGRWVYFSETGNVKAEGNFEKDKKTGIWKYYFETGELKSVENYETGEINLYRIDGSLRERYFLKDDLTEGDVEFFYPFGPLADRIPYKADKREGKGTTLYPSGKKQIVYEYKDGKATGEWNLFYENGQRSAIKRYKDNYYDGLYEEFYPDGRKKVVGTYTEGVANGIWTYYYPNGQLQKEGSYKNDLTVGLWKFYTPMGEISSTVNYNEKGERHGVGSDFMNGKPYNFFTYKNGMVTKIVYVDWNGKELGSFGNGNGTFQAKMFYPTGQLNGEGSYKNGEFDGKWTYYFPEGTKLSEYTYKEGIVQTGIEYHRNGRIRFTFPYQNGELHGYLVEYFPDGTVRQEGWYQNGQRQQQFLTYTSNGVLETDYYYLNDELHDYAWDYNTDGKKDFATKYYNQGDIERIEQYNAAGENIFKETRENGVTTYQATFSNGKPRATLQLIDGNYTGTVSYWYPDGSLFYSFGNESNKRNGPIAEYRINGKLTSKATYRDGVREGKVTRYHANGKIEAEGIYVAGELDSIWTYYYEFGGIYYTAAYSKGERQGITRTYSSEGKPIVEKFYVSNELTAFRTVQANGEFGEWQNIKVNSTIIAKYPSGVTAYEEHFKNGLQHGVKRINFPSGKPYVEFTLNEGDLEGAYTIYHPNGNPAEKKFYVKDELTGQCEFYNEDGTLMLSETYLHGVRNGKAVMYEKGVNVKEVIFWSGMPQ